MGGKGLRNTVKKAILSDFAHGGIKSLLLHRSRAGLEASYLLPISPPSFSWVSLRFLDRLLPSQSDRPTNDRPERWAHSTNQ
ncbi:hypothetical protein RND71_025538 [Anisodus tanguticus]|uniref:Uncharacterized protein n=1 Tax=Anisodus tanguticus TaxID=243964 RepID=A0AAE1RT80_9SOLA|nr:hypothetical protein RND71_025538 [Anisodus tanguticus]